MYSCRRELVSVDFRSLHPSAAVTRTCPVTFPNWCLSGSIGISRTFWRDFWVSVEWFNFLCVQRHRFFWLSANRGFRTVTSTNYLTFKCSLNPCLLLQALQVPRTKFWKWGRRRNRIKMAFPPHCCSLGCAAVWAGTVPLLWCPVQCPGELRQLQQPKIESITKPD